MGREGCDGSGRGQATQAQTKVSEGLERVIVGMCWDNLAVSFHRSRKCVCVGGGDGAENCEGLEG